jgi:hypothetical protein
MDGRCSEKEGICFYGIIQMKDWKEIIVGPQGFIRAILALTLRAAVIPSRRAKGPPFAPLSSLPLLSNFELMFRRNISKARTSLPEPFFLSYSPDYVSQQRVILSAADCVFPLSLRIQNIIRVGAVTSGRMPCGSARPWMADDTTIIIFWILRERANCV